MKLIFFFFFDRDVFMRFPRGSRSSTMLPPTLLPLEEETWAGYIHVHIQKTSQRNYCIQTGNKMCDILFLREELFTLAAVVCATQAETGNPAWRRVCVTPALRGALQFVCVFVSSVCKSHIHAGTH